MVSYLSKLKEKNSEGGRPPPQSIRRQKRFTPRFSVRSVTLATRMRKLSCAGAGNIVVRFHFEKRHPVPVARPIVTAALIMRHLRINADPGKIALEAFPRHAHAVGLCAHAGGFRIL